MTPPKLIALLLIVLGCVFRAISLAYFKKRARLVPDTPKARRQFAARKQRALLIDALFVVAGFYLLLHP